MNGDMDGGDEHPVMEDRHSPCPGFRPDLNYPSVSNYAFGTHNEEGVVFGWKVEVGAGELRIRAVSEGGRQACTGNSPSAGGPCKPCADLEFHPKFTG